MCRRYMCKEHLKTWTITCGTAGTSLEGDLLGTKYVVTGDFWPGCFRVFQETENYEAVRRHLCGCTSASMERRLAANKRTQRLSDFERAVLHRAISLRLQQIPTCNVLAKWMALYVRRCPMDKTLGLILSPPGGIYHSGHTPRAAQRIFHTGFALPRVA